MASEAMNRLMMGAAVVALVFGAIYMKQPNRNVRNNNPLNIESGDDWVGLADYQGDPRFAVFDGPEYGFRAAFIILLRYLERGEDTILKIVATWAPASDNNHVDKYSAFVAERVGKGVNDVILPGDLPGVMLAMADFEGAKGAYDLAVVEQGIALAMQADFVIARLDRLGAYA